MKHLIIAVLVSLGIVVAPSFAQQPPAGPQHDPIAEQVLPPELIMQHQKAIGLTEAQRTSLIAEVKRVQTRMVDLHFDLQRAAERMVELLGQDRIDEASAVAQLDKVLAAEREIKQLHTVLAVRLKNMLTPEQQRMLRELRANAGGARR